MKQLSLFTLFLISSFGFSFNLDFPSNEKEAISNKPSSPKGPNKDNECFKMALRRSHLTNDQQKKTHMLVAELHNEIKSIMPNIEMSKKALFAELKNHPINATKAIAHHADLGDSMLDIGENVFRTKITIINLLNDRQRHMFNRVWGHCMQH